MLSGCDFAYTILPDSTRASILLSGINYFLSAATTICATLMIALKITLVTRTSHANHSYSKVIDILVQSAALVSFVQVVNSTIIVAVYAQLNSNPNILDNPVLDSLTDALAYISSCRLAVVVRVHFDFGLMKCTE